MDMETGLTKVDNNDHESDLSKPAIDLLPPEMLLSIYKFLPFPDLLACRAVNKNWRSAASDAVKKRGNAIPFGEGDLLKDTRKRELALNNLIDCVNATGGDFPVDKFELSFENCDQSKMRKLLHDVSPFASELTFHFCLEMFLIMRNDFLSNMNKLPTIFRKLKYLGVEISGAGFNNNVPLFQRKEIIDVDIKILKFIRRIIQKAPQLENVSLGILGNFTITRANIPQCLDGFGLRDKMKLLRTLKIEASFRIPLDWNALAGFGLRLKHLIVRRMENAGDGDGLNLFLKSQANTLLTLVLDISGSFRRISVNFPCLSVLQKLKIERQNSDRNRNPIKFPTICYTKLPALKELCLLKSGGTWRDFIKGNEMTPALTVVKLNLPWGLLDEDSAVIQQVATLFPNLTKLGLPIENRKVAVAVYKHLSSIEELTLFERKSDAGGWFLLDQVITGFLECSRAKAPPSRWWYWTVANLERPTHAKKCLASLTKLNLLKIEPDVRDDNWAGLQFNEISGYVVKRMESLECIDFGIRRFPPLIPSALKNDLEKHVALVYRPPLHRRSAIDMVDRDNYSQYSTDENDSEDEL